MDKLSVEQDKSNIPSLNPSRILEAQRFKSIYTCKHGWV